MGLFGNEYKDKYWKLVQAIDDRYRLYELLVTKGSKPHPKGIETLLQEFKNLKLRAWAIEKGDNQVAKIIKDLREEELRLELAEKGDIK